MLLPSIPEANVSYSKISSLHLYNIVSPMFYSSSFSALGFIIRSLSHLRKFFFKAIDPGLFCLFVCLLLSFYACVSSFPRTSL